MGVSDRELGEAIAKTYPPPECPVCTEIVEALELGPDGLQRCPTCHDERWGTSLDVPPPKPSEPGNRVVQGWSINAYNRTIFRSWSHSVGHGTGWPYNEDGSPKDPDRYISGSQNARRQFSSFERAKRALVEAVWNQATAWTREIEAMTTDDATY